MSSVDPVTGEISEEVFPLNESEGVGKRRLFRTSVGKYFDKLIGRHQNLDGSEIPDPVPMAPPIGYKKQKSMVEIIRDQIRSAQLAYAAEAAGAETFEEADDFDVDDDFEPVSAYEFERFFEPPAENRPGRPEADRPEPAEPASAAPSGGVSPAPAAPAARPGPSA